MSSSKVTAHSFMSAEFDSGPNTYAFGNRSLDPAATGRFLTRAQTPSPFEYAVGRARCPVSLPVAIAQYTGDLLGNLYTLINNQPLTIFRPPFWAGIPMRTEGCYAEAFITALEATLIGGGPLDGHATIDVRVVGWVKCVSVLVPVPCEPWTWSIDIVGYAGEPIFVPSEVIVLNFPLWWMWMAFVPPVGIFVEPKERRRDFDWTVVGLLARGPVPGFGVVRFVMFVEATVTVDCPLGAGASFTKWAAVQ